MNKYQISQLQEENRDLHSIINLMDKWNYNYAFRDTIYKGQVEQKNEICRATGSLEEYVRMYDGIYIYGAGKKATRIARQIMNNGYDICGFLVSSTEKLNDRELLGKRIFYINEIIPAATIGLVVALNRTNTIAAAGEIVTSGFNSMYFAQ